LQTFRDDCRHKPENTVTALLWDSSRSALILAGSRMNIWRNKGVIQTSQRSHDAAVVSGDAMSNVHVWLVENGQLVFRFSNAHGTSKISSMCFDTSERRLITGANNGTVIMWNFSSGQVSQPLAP
ncbi:unnamed protein product, partial [Choristocarpus tenellus]